MDILNFDVGGDLTFECPARHFTDSCLGKIGVIEFDTPYFPNFLEGDYEALRDSVVAFSLLLKQAWDNACADDHNDAVVMFADGCKICRPTLLHYPTDNGLYLGLSWATEFYPQSRYPEPPYILSMNPVIPWARPLGYFKDYDLYLIWTGKDNYELLAWCGPGETPGRCTSLSAARPAGEEVFEVAYSRARAINAFFGSPLADFQPPTRMFLKTPAWYHKMPREMSFAISIS